MNLLDILKPNNTRKVVVFGTGSLAAKVADWVKEYEIEYFVDNNPTKWNESFMGREVKSPEVLLKAPFGSYLILVASSYVLEVTKQLESMGFISKEDIIDCNYIAYTAAGEFYSPLPSMVEVREHEQKALEQGAPKIHGIDFNLSEQLSLLNDFEIYKELFPYTENISKFDLRYPMQPNSFFSNTDAMNLFCFMNKFKPKNVIEIGSGFTSALMLDVNEHFLDSAVSLDFIEPYPDRLHSLLSLEDVKHVTIHEMRLQDVPLTVFDKLDSGDILFIDSSHVVKLGSDVNWLFSDILPRLKSGVIIHFHDIEYPFEYPLHWLREGRAWNEAYMLRSFLQYNDSFKIIYWNSYLSACCKSELDSHFSEYHGGGSIWIRKL